eukprot:TRINITY_DN4124_c0_g1_i2.p1 TRINITY_DN4124_c0_g1~~TRINITY_DN4124_c0_g1_i2.p1  ORF type:complete len:124 (+),score=16.74 TRINITY_DN4124_c0_g1_i2:186-557(+)
MRRGRITDAVNAPPRRDRLRSSTSRFNVNNNAICKISHMFLAPLPSSISRCPTMGRKREREFHQVKKSDQFFLRQIDHQIQMRFKLLMLRRTVNCRGFGHFRVITNVLARERRDSESHNTIGA